MDSRLRGNDGRFCKGLQYVGARDYFSRLRDKAATTGTKCRPYWLPVFSEALGSARPGMIGKLRDDAGCVGVALLG